MKAKVKPVFGIDIDGVLGDYHRHFIKCAEMFTQREMPAPEEINPRLPLHRHLGLPKSRYREIKMAYRQGRWKRSMPVFPGARELTMNLRRAGAEVVVCTTRPFNQLGEVDTDTRWWLRHHGIQCDNLIWGPHKYRDLVKTYGHNSIVAVLDDELEQMERCVKMMLPFFLRDQPYNNPQGHVKWEFIQGRSENPIRRVSDLWDAQEQMMIDLKNWHAEELGQY